MANRCGFDGRHDADSEADLMVWARLDDAILDNPKIAKAGVIGFAMHVAAITWCSRNLSDGFIPDSAVRRLLDLPEVPYEYVGLVECSGHVLDDVNESLNEIRSLKGDDVAKWLVECRLWERDETRSGYVVHDFLDYNPSKKEVEEDRARKSSAGRAGAQKRWHSPKQNDSGVPSESMAESVRTRWQNDSPIPIPIPIHKSERESAREAPPLESLESERQSETVTCAPVTKLNAAADGAFGGAITAWAEGIRLVTGKPFTTPAGQSTEMTKLVMAMRAHCPDVSVRVEWARDAGAAFAKEHRGKLSTHTFVDWLNSPRESAVRMKTVADTKPKPMSDERVTELMAELAAKRAGGPL
jgi:hypothetical protein